MKEPMTGRHGSAVVTLPSDTEVLITRTFDAPAALVFEAYTTPELVRRWYGFAEDEWLVCEIDLRVGGKWRFVTKHEDYEVGFQGEYREVSPPDRLVATECYEGIPDPEGNAALNTVTFEERDGVTTMTILVQLPNKDARDMMIESGMERGMQISYDRLEDVLRDGQG
jgi:uncharacterized protein YndB with AHSA1/START domain